MRTHSLCFFGAALAAAATAQDSRHYHPAAGHVVAFRISGLPAQQQALRALRMFRLSQDPDLRAAIDLATERYVARDGQLVQLLETASRETTDQQAEDLMMQLRGFENLDIEELRGWVYDVGDEPAFVLSLRAGAAGGDGLGAMWDKVSAMLTKGKTYERRTDGKVLDGLASELFVRRTDDAVDTDLPERIQVWHRGLQLVVTLGAEAPLGELQDAAPPRSAMDTHLCGDSVGAFVEIDIARASAIAGAERDADDRRRAAARLKAVGVDNIRSLGLALAWEGEVVRQSLEVAADGPIGGMIGAWVDASAPLPAHPQIEGAMLQVGGALDFAKLDAAIAAAAAADDAEPDAPADDEPDRLRALVPDLGKALTGGVSLLVSAPARGSLVPRLSLALAVADRPALDALLLRARQELDGLTFEDRDTDGTPWTSVRIPNSPSSVVPSFAVLDDTLWLAESPATLRALLRARGNAPTAMSTEGAPPATHLGDPVPALDVRYDAAAIWRVVDETYGPLVKLGMSQVRMFGGDSEPLLEAKELPDLRAAARELGLGRAGLARTANGFVLSAAGPAGDPLTTAFMAIYAPLLPTFLGAAVDSSIHQAQSRVAAARMRKVHSALATFRTSFGNGSTLPKELGELFQRGLLEGDDALRVPGDPGSSRIEYEDADGEIQTVDSSFRYSPEGKLKTTRDALLRHRDWLAMVSLMPLPDSGEESPQEVAILLYEQRPHPRGSRLVLTAGGEILAIDEDGAKEILGQ